jgi:hypothetical protein
MVLFSKTIALVRTSNITAMLQGGGAIVNAFSKKISPSLTAYGDGRCLFLCSAFVFPIRDIADYA